MRSLTIAVDLAKHVFELALSNEPGTVLERRRLTRSQFERFWTDRPPCRVVMEACASARVDAGHRNRAAVALANKMARILWAVWRHERAFNGDYLPLAP